MEEGPCWDAHGCLAVAVKKRKTGGEEDRGERGKMGNTFPEMKWPKSVIPSGGAMRGGEPEATGRILIAKSSIIQ